MSVDWNAESYHKVSEPQLKWGLELLSTLELRGDETVLDAGCGSGRLTAHLFGKLPRGSVIALDVSKQMLEVARRELAPFGDRVRFVDADLLSLPRALDRSADVVFSAATFHWVLDHHALFRELARVLKPGGRLRAQCGGLGNLQGFMALTAEVAKRPEYARYFDGFVYPAHYAGVDPTVAALEQAGFHPPRVWLTPKPTRFETRSQFETFTSSVVLRHPLARLPEALRADFTSAVAELSERGQMPLTLDYVRLDLDTVL